MKKVLIRIFCLIFVLGIIFINEWSVMADGNYLEGGFKKDLIKEESPDGELTGKFETVRDTIVAVVQALAVAGVAITGFKYMMAGPSEKSKIKETLIWMAIGLILVTSANVVIRIVENAGKQALAGH